MELRNGIDLNQAIHTTPLTETSGTDTDLRKVSTLHQLFSVLDNYPTDQLISDIFPDSCTSLVNLMTNPTNHKVKLAAVLTHLEVMGMEVEGARRVAELFNDPDAFEETYDDIHQELYDLAQEFRRPDGLGDLGNVRHNPIIDTGAGTCSPVQHHGVIPKARPPVSHPSRLLQQGE